MHPLISAAQSAPILPGNDTTLGTRLLGSHERVALLGANKFKVGHPVPFTNQIAFSGVFFIVVTFCFPAQQLAGSVLRSTTLWTSRGSRYQPFYHSSNLRKDVCRLFLSTKAGILLKIERLFIRSPLLSSTACERPPVPELYSPPSELSPCL